MRIHAGESPLFARLCGAIDPLVLEVSIVLYVCAFGFGLTAASIGVILF